MPKKVSSKKIVLPIKLPAVWQIGMLFPNGKKISKPKCSLNELFNTYFIGLDKYLDKGYDAEKLLDLYKKNFEKKEIKVQINYIDSYGHKWTGKVAWPKEEKFIEYLNKKLND